MTLTSRELSFLSNTDVLGYIQAKNVELNAQAKAEGWTFWTLMAEGIADDYDNVYELELSFARGTWYDVHKEAWGFKGRVSESLSLEQVEAEIEEMSDMAAEQFKAEQEWLAEQKIQEREEVALGMKQPAADMKLEQWEVYETKAEEAGYGA